MFLGYRTYWKFDFKNSVILTRKPYILTGKKAIKYNFMYFMYSRYEHLINFNAAFCRVDK